jgi:nicotinate dehydrogenase subunit B
MSAPQGGSAVPVARPRPGAPIGRFPLELPDEIERWLAVDLTGAVTVFTGKVEVGQGIRTSLAQAVADELRVPIDRVQLVMGDTARVPFDLGTFGSMTTPIMAAHLRRMAAAAREALIERAGRRWNVPREEVAMANGTVVHSATARSVGLGELAAEAPLAGKAGSVEGTPATAWTVAGRDVQRVDGRAKVTGTHRYPSDVRLPGMVYGKILRPPSATATLRALDTRAAEALPGVRVVRAAGVVGVVAPEEWLAAQALSTLKAEWEETPAGVGDDLFRYLRSHRDPAAENAVLEEQGSLQEGLAGATYRLQGTYTVAPIAHAPLEPRAAVAAWQDGQLTVWTGTQRPFGVREELVRSFNLPESAVRVLVPDTGAGYGGKHTGDAAREAALLAREVGAPVRVVWTRAEEFRWVYMRPAAVIEIQSGTTADGILSAWEYHNYNSGPQAMRPPYAIADQQLAFHPTLTPLRQGSYRALAATANHFARETHIDEVAHAAGRDPLEFRLRNLTDARAIAVLQAAAQHFGWQDARRARDGRGRGLALGHEKGSYVAACVEVALEGPERAVRVLRVVQAFECGAVVHPDGLRGQVEGAIIQGLGGALFEQLEISDGRIITEGFSGYRVPRFSDIPTIETVLLDRKDLPSAGAGETPIVAVAPAIGNAIFHLSGRRLRTMPLAPHGLGASVPDPVAAP